MIDHHIWAILNTVQGFVLYREPQAQIDLKSNRTAKYGAFIFQLSSPRPFCIRLSYPSRVCHQSAKILPYACQNSSCNADWHSRPGQAYPDLKTAHKYQNRATVGLHIHRTWESDKYGYLIANDVCRYELRYLNLLSITIWITMACRKQCKFLGNKNWGCQLIIW